MSEPVQCTGNELPEVLAGLRAQGKTSWALDVVGNSGYSVEYFSGSPAVAENPRDGEGTPRTPERRVIRRVNAICPDAPAQVSPVAAPAPLCEFCGGSLASDGSCPICARMWAIREKAVQNRRVYKPKRGNDHARLPHPND